MSDLVVISFDDEHRGFLVRDAMANMQKERLASLQDAAVAVRGEDGRVSIHQTANLVKAGAFGGAFWGFLVGLIFSVPFFGTAISAAAGALTGSLPEIGVDDHFVKEVSERLQPGNSAIFLIFSDAKYGRLLEELELFDGVVVQTSLSREQETRLKEVYAE